MTVWEYLNTLTPARRANAIMFAVNLLQLKYALTALDIVDQTDAIENDLAEWLQSSAKDVFGLE